MPSQPSNGNRMVNSVQPGSHWTKRIQTLYPGGRPEDVRMPEEFHGWRRPSHQMLQQLYLMAWFDKYSNKNKGVPTDTNTSQK